jgi:hypothetical protein
MQVLQHVSLRYVIAKLVMLYPKLQQLTLLHQLKHTATESYCRVQCCALESASD